MAAQREARCSPFLRYRPFPPHSLSSLILPSFFSATSPRRTRPCSLEFSRVPPIVLPDQQRILLSVESDVNHHDAVVEEDRYANLLLHSGGHGREVTLESPRADREVKRRTFFSTLFAPLAPANRTLDFIRELLDASSIQAEHTHRSPGRNAGIKDTTFRRRRRSFPRQWHRLSLGRSARIMTMINRRRRSNARENPTGDLRETVAVFDPQPSSARSRRRILLDTFAAVLSETLS